MLWEEGSRPGEAFQLVRRKGKLFESCRLIVSADFFRGERRSNKGELGKRTPGCPLWTAGEKVQEMANTKSRRSTAKLQQNEECKATDHPCEVASPAAASQDFAAEAQAQEPKFEATLIQDEDWSALVSVEPTAPRCARIPPLCCAFFRRVYPGPKKSLVVFRRGVMLFLVFSRHLHPFLLDERASD